jgi:hypothetical protein
MKRFALNVYKKKKKLKIKNLPNRLISHTTEKWTTPEIKFGEINQ